MFRVLFIPVLGPKITYYQGGIYIPVLVCPESLGDFVWCIAVGFEVFLERFVRYDPCLRQAIHYFFESDIHVGVALLVFQFILVYYLLGVYFYCYFFIFVFLSWNVQVEVPDIYKEVFSVWVGEYNVPIEFGRG